MLPKPTVNLHRWHPGEPLDHRKLNQPVDALNGLLGGTRPPRQVGSKAKPQGLVAQQFRLKAVADDHLVCRTWDGLAEGAVDVLIAKPWLLRRSPFDGATRAGISYTYTTSGERVASQGADTETQVIVPSYAVDDLIYAARGILGGLAVSHNGEQLAWLDLNLDARAWAQQAPTP